MAVKRYNVRMAGLGGQGVVTASHILSNGVVISGGHSFEIHRDVLFVKSFDNRRESM